MCVSTESKREGEREQEREREMYEELPCLIRKL